MTGLMSATEVVVARHPGFLWIAPSWDLAAQSGESLGSVVREPGGGTLFGRCIRYTVTAASTEPVWLLDQYSSMRVSRFVVAGPAGELIGEVVQENALFAPQFRLVGADGAVVRLDGGRMGSWTWTVEDLAGNPLGRVRRQSTSLPAMFVKERSYLVERGEGLGAGLWPLALLSSICLDIVHDRKRRDGGSA